MQTIFCHVIAPWHIQAGGSFYYNFHEYHQTTRPQIHSRFLFKSHSEEFAVSLFYSYHFR